MDAKEGMTFASRSVAEHLARGLLGFAALTYAFVKIAEGSPWFVRRAIGRPFSSTDDR